MKKVGITTQIFIGLALGIAIGAVFYGNPAVAGYLKPLGDIFIRLIKMIVVPIVISTLIIGVSSVGDMKKLGKIGGKSILYFEIVTTVAFIIGLVAANLLKPGAGVDMSHLQKTDIQNYVTATEKVGHNFTDTLVHIVPTNIFQSIANGEMLSIIFFSVMFGLGVTAVGEKGKPVIRFFEGVADAMFWVTNKIMKLAPVGVFALIGVTVSKFGVASLIPLGKLVLCLYGAMLFFVLVVLGVIARMCGTRIMTIIQILKSELLLAYSTASSETVLPKIMEKMERYGCPKGITSFVIPIGYSFNLDGSSLYQALTAIFIAQMYGMDLSIGTQITIMLVLMISSKGIAGVPGSAFIVLLATLGSVNIPLEGLAFIAGIDRILDMARTVVNVLGNSLAAIVISKWEGQYNSSKAKQYAASFQREPVQEVA